VAPLIAVAQCADGIREQGVSDVVDDVECDRCAHRLGRRTHQVGGTKHQHTVSEVASAEDSNGDQEAAIGWRRGSSPTGELRVDIAAAVRRFANQKEERGCRERSGKQTEQEDPPKPESMEQEHCDKWTEDSAQSVG